ncbi:hypothetical protein BASA81_001457 [Batrachochytrium salamandrivorans]|nr:hypothetical protein BASA81_001457 [Batrachochytrium salamandrivorans]
MDEPTKNQALVSSIARDRQAYKQSKKPSSQHTTLPLAQGSKPVVKDVVFKRNLLLPAAQSASSDEAVLESVTIRSTPEDLEIPSPALTWQDERLPQNVFGKFHDKFHSDMGKPTTVQSCLWPIMLRGYDCLAVAPTGSGKTLSFALPMACHARNRITSGASPISPTTCLVLSPTRELAIQINKAMKSFVKLFDLLSVAIHGGGGREVSEGAADESAGANILVATPGRCIDFLAQKRINLSFVSLVCIDEADRMLEMGFKEDCEKICAHLPGNRQLVLTTATWTSKSVKNSGSSDWLLNPVKNVHIICNKLEGSDKMNLAHRGKKEDEEEEEAAAAMEEEEEGGAITIPSTITQIVHVCAEHKKPRKLIRHVEKTHAAEAQQRAYGPMIVFCNKIKTVLFVYEFLAKQELRVVALHGSMAQEKRTRALEDFRAGKYCILVATDVAGRGLHIPNLKHVVNYDFPTSLAQYAHRVGRCGRKTGSNGSAYSFFTRNLAAMAVDLTAILEASNQTVDPNLKALSEERKDFRENEEQPFQDADLQEEEEPVAKRAKVVRDGEEEEEEEEEEDGEDDGSVDDFMDSVGAVPLKSFATKGAAPKHISSTPISVAPAREKKAAFKRPRGVRGGKKNKKKPGK